MYGAGGLPMTALQWLKKMYAHNGSPQNARMKLCGYQTGLKWSKNIKKIKKIPKCMRRGGYFLIFGGRDPYGPHKTSGRPNVEILRVTKENVCSGEGLFQ